MSIDGSAERRRILDAMEAEFPAMKHFTFIPDDLVLEKVNGEFIPYTVWNFQEPFLIAGDHTFAPLEEQPHLFAFTVQIWAPDADSAWEAAAPIRVFLAGFDASIDGNATPVTLRGGGDFQRRDSAVRPSRAARTIAGEMIINMSSTKPMMQP